MNIHQLKHRVFIDMSNEEFAALSVAALIKESQDILACAHATALRIERMEALHHNDDPTDISEMPVEVDGDVRV